MKSYDYDNLLMPKPEDTCMLKVHRQQEMHDNLHMHICISFRCTGNWVKS